MATVVEFNRKVKFTLDKAQSILPIIYRITDDAQKEVRAITNRIDAYKDKLHPQVPILEKEIDQILETWQNKMTKLGCKPKGIWLVDFDNGQGYFCWKFPETQILYWHGYQDGFSGRRLVSDLVQNELT